MASLIRLFVQEACKETMRTAPDRSWLLRFWGIGEDQTDVAGVVRIALEERSRSCVEEQSEGYAKAKLKWVSDDEPLPFLQALECNQVTARRSRYRGRSQSRPATTSSRVSAARTMSSASR